MSSADQPISPRADGAIDGRVLLILAHPEGKSFGAALAQAYADGARAAGCDVDLMHLCTLDFDATPQVRPDSLEPVLIQARKRILACRHLVLVYPTWLGAMPARLKGFFERVFGDGFAMRMRPDSILPEGLLKGRSADVLVTMDTPPLVYRFLLGEPGHKLVRRAILAPAGIRPVRMSTYGPLRGSSDGRRQGWLATTRSDALRSCSRLVHKPR